jgi:hypothetical protein
MNCSKLTATVALVIMHAAVYAQPPQPSAEHKRLAYFSGSWSFTGAAKESPMGPAGPITFKETCELMAGGFALVCRSEGESPMGPTKAVAIMSYDAEKKAYTYTAAESNVPVFTAAGQTKGATWTWNTDMMMGKQRMFTRVTVTERGPNAYDFAMEFSLDGKSFARVIEGKATKAS